MVAAAGMIASAIGGLNCRPLGGKSSWQNRDRTLTAGSDVSLLVTVYHEPMVAKVGGEESLATVAEQLWACQYSY